MFAMIVIVVDLNEGQFELSQTFLLMWFGLKATAFFLIPSTIALIIIRLLNDRVSVLFVIIAIVIANLGWGFVGYHGLFEFLFFPDLELRNALTFPLILAAAGLAVRYATRYIRQVRALSEARRRQIESETKFLALQLLPHTLFNMLNTAYSIVLENKQAGADYLLKLAELMRHLTQSADDLWTQAEEELEFIKTFAELEQPRVTGDIKLDFAVTGDTAVPVPSILFVTLFENALKHGRQSDGSVDIKVDYIGQEDGFEFVMSNSMPEVSGARAHKKGLGVGLTNTKRRLELLYPDRHTFSATFKEYAFEAKVKVWS